MKRRLTIFSLIALALLISAALMMTSPVYAGGAPNIFGIGSFDTGTCTLESGYDFVHKLRGSLKGCFNVKVESSRCTPGGIYQEKGINKFVGMYDGGTGTFEARYHFMGKFKDCNEFDFEFFGHCEHPIIKGGGTGVFEDVTGWLHFRDNVEDGMVVNFPYQGYLRK